MADTLHINGLRYQAVAEAALACGVTEAEVAAFAGRGAIRAMRAGQRLYVGVDSLRAYLDRLQEPNAPATEAHAIAAIPARLDEDVRPTRSNIEAEEETPLVLKPSAPLKSSRPLALLPVAGVALGLLFLIATAVTASQSQGMLASVGSAVGSLIGSVTIGDIAYARPESQIAAVLESERKTLAQNSSSVTPQQSTPSSLSPSGTTTIVQNYVTQPARAEPVERVVERVVEKQTIVSGISESVFATGLQQLKNKLTSLIANTSAQASSQTAAVYQTVVHTNRIDHLGSVDIDGGSTWTGGTITGATITGGSLAGSSISGDISVNVATATSFAATGSATSTFVNGIALTGGCITVNGTCLSSFSNALASGGTATTTFYSGGVVFSDGSKLTQAAAASNFFWDNTNNRLGVGTSSPWALLSVNPNGISVPAFAVGSSTATNFVVDNAGRVGVGTSTPGSTFSIQGVGNFVANSTSTLSNGLNVSTVNLTSTTASSTAANGINLSGGCFAVNGSCITSGTDTVVRLSAIQSYTSTQTWTKPAGISYAVVEIWGGGGGGGYGSGGQDGVTANGGGGGGGGGYTMKTFTASALAATTSVRATVGAGGSTAPAAGGNSDFGGMATSTGGSAGSPASGNGAAGAGGAGGSGSGGDVNVSGGAGSKGGTSVTTSSTDAIRLSGSGGRGGDSPRGGQGGRGGEPITGASGDGGTAGTTPGGGGGGANGRYSGQNTGDTGGAGAAGMIIVYEYTTVTSGTDLAENYPTTDPTLGAGELVQVDGVNPISIKRADKSDPSPTIGIVSTKPGLLLTDEEGLKNNSGQRPVALSGRVPTKVNLENGPIAIGDRVALSSTPGEGMRAGPLDASVGIALEPYDAFHSNLIIVFMDLQPGVNLEAIGSALLGQTASVATAAGASSTSTSTATSTTSVSSLTSFLRSLFARLVEWFADATNGIQDFFAERVYTKEICLIDDTGSSTCVTRMQLDTLLASSAITSEEIAPSVLPTSSPAEEVGEETADAPPVVNAPEAASTTEVSEAALTPETVNESPPSVEETVEPEPDAVPQAAVVEAGAPESPEATPQTGEPTAAEPTQ